MMFPFPSKYGSFNTLTFSDVFPSFESFSDCREEFKLVCPETRIDADTLELCYLLLLTRYGESHFAGYNSEMAAMKVIQMVGSYAPALKQKLKIQDKLVSFDLDGDELLNGTSQIFNHADHPNTDPSTATLEELTYIDSQSTQKVRRGKLEAYAMLMQLMDGDLYDEFTNRFQKLFIRIAQPQRPTLYENEEDEP